MKLATLVGALSAATIGCGDSARCITVDCEWADAPARDIIVQCSPLNQIGCLSDGSEKCTWIRDTSEPSGAGHFGCAPRGTVEVGEQCSISPDIGADDCVNTAACRQAGESCRAVCDPTGDFPTCPMGAQCMTYADFFTLPGMSASAGLCI